MAVSALSIEEHFNAIDDIGTNQPACLVDTFKLDVAALPCTPRRGIEVVGGCRTTVSTFGEKQFSDLIQCECRVAYILHLEEYSSREPWVTTIGGRENASERRRFEDSTMIAAHLNTRNSELSQLAGDRNRRTIVPPEESISAFIHSVPPSHSYDPPGSSCPSSTTLSSDCSAPCSSKTGLMARVSGFSLIFTRSDLTINLIARRSGLYDGKSVLAPTSSSDGGFE